VVAPPRASLDLERFDDLREAIHALRPDVVINAAAYTDVDGAEVDPAVAHRVNGDAPGVLARASREVGALLVHYSTDYVFDGRARRPYTEADPPNPLSVYGASKLRGETAVQEERGHHLILRLSWVYGGTGRNFLRTIQARARTRTELRVVDDQWGAPTWCRAVAETTAHILRLLRRGDHHALPEHRNGVYHLSAAGQASRYEFARAILEWGGHGERCARLTPIPTADHPTPAARPAYPVLDNGRLQRAFGVRLAPWDSMLQEALELELREVPAG
jgi:dTDP-4-dehydrorhamnose reductase